MNVALGVILGVIVGAGLTALTLLWRRRQTQELARQLIEQVQADKLSDLQHIIHEVQAAFGKLSQEALAANSEQLLRLAETKFTAQSKQAETTLDARKQLIDETVKQIATRLTEVNTALQTLEKERRESHGTLRQKLEETARVTSALQDTTARLREALANPQRRGQWGERMAEDVLRLAGFIEGVNYSKQAVLAGGNRPDFTFPLPPNRRVNMDVKFPLANYMKYLDGGDEAVREQSKTAFLRDVRARIKEVTARDYIDPDAGTVDYVLVFIPNEQMYAFLHEHDPALLDDALQQKVVLCSPLTLYAILAVLRQTAGNFRLEQTSQEILALLAAFRREWGKYSELMDRLGKALDQASQHYEALATTRTRKLERQLDKIEDLRTERGVLLPPAEGEEA